MGQSIRKINSTYLSAENNTKIDNILYTNVPQENKNYCNIDTNDKSNNVNSTLFMNVQGLMGKSFEFYSEINRLDPDVLCFVETWHIRKQTSIIYDRYKIAEKQGTREENIGRYKGGIIIGIRKNLDSSVLLFNDYYCIIKIEKFIFVFAYISPGR